MGRSRAAARIGNPPPGPPVDADPPPCPDLLAAIVRSPPARSRSRANAGTPATVTTDADRRAAVADSLEALGTAQANESVAITAKASDVVTRLAFDSGERVRAGQLLVGLRTAAQRYRRRCVSHPARC